jgi:microsomal epoxide hydrolase
MGWSGPPVRKGADCTFVANMMLELMNRLGYDQFVIQGADWGAICGMRMAQMFPDRVLGLHISFLPLLPPFSKGVMGFFSSITSLLKPEWVLDAEEAERLRSLTHYLLEETGYLHLQATKPMTLAHALTDSVMGNAAYTIEKFHSWSDHNGTLEDVWTRDELLDIQMVYFNSDNAAPGVRFYYENFHSSMIEDSLHTYINTPTGVTVFPKEIAVAPRKWAEYYLNIVHWTTQPRGGHFAAWEQPELLANDIRMFVTNHVKYERKKKAGSAATEETAEEAKQENKTEL